MNTSRKAAPFTSLQFGVRQADHHRTFGRSAKAFHSATYAAPDPSLAVAYPGNFGAALGGNFESAGFYFPRDVLTNYFSGQIKETTPEFERLVSTEGRRARTPARALPDAELRDRRQQAQRQRRLPPGPHRGRRADPDAGAHLDLPAHRARQAGHALRRRSRRDQHGRRRRATYYDNTAWNPLAGTIYYKKASHKNFDNILPSMNLRWEMAKDWVGRLGLSETIGRQNYNLYGANFSGQTCGEGGCTVSGPNPDLKPLISKNFDLSVAWYFARRAMVSISAFTSNIDGYPKTGAIKQDSTVDLLDPVTNTVKTYFINTTTQQKARIRGLELAYTQPIGGGFGFESNASVASTKVADGRPMVGASKYAANLGGYFENDIFSIRLVYNYRSEYVSSTTAPSPTTNSQGNSVINGRRDAGRPDDRRAGVQRALSANYNVTPELQIAFSATNLTNPSRAQYRYSELEQQKLDASGRQYYLEARYKF